MVKVKYASRILVDDGFIRWLIKKDKTAFFHLTHIKSSSVDAKKEHNVILEEDSKKILAENHIKEATLKGAFKCIPLLPSIPTSLNDIDKRIITAIVLATQRPFKTHILTTKVDEQKYKDSSHAKDVRSISIKSEEDALVIIDSLWRQFLSERNSYR